MSIVDLFKRLDPDKVPQNISSSLDPPKFPSKHVCSDKRYYEGLDGGGGLKKAM